MKKLSAVLIGSLVLSSAMYAYDYPYQNKVQKFKYGYNASASGYVNQIVGTIADQLGQNKDFANIKDTPIAITSVVDLKDFKKTDKLGNIISENLIHEMQVRGFQVVDFKTMPSIKIDKNGDYIFSRVVKELRTKHNINYVLAGTYTKYSDGVAVNCRLIDLKTNVVKSTAQTYIPNGLINAANYNSSMSIYPVKTVKVIPGVKINSVQIEEQK